MSLVIFVLEVPVSNIGPEILVLTEIFHGFFKSRKTNVVMKIQIMLRPFTSASFPIQRY